MKEIEVTIGTTLTDMSDQNASELGMEVEEVACLAPAQGLVYELYSLYLMFV